MSNIRFDRIRLHNFKGVVDLDFNMSDYDAVILGGKNGYGKTTIFDALELVITGKIARYSSYRESFIDNRRAYSQEERPLVCSKDVEDVRLDVFITILGNEDHPVKRILTRQARTADMKNPVDFEVFRVLEIREKEEDEPVEATQFVLQELGLTDFFQYYTTLNYMSQEESTRFIKSKDTKRVEEVQFLFNTYEYDRRIDKIDKVLLKALKEKERIAKEKKQRLEQTISALKQYGLNELGEMPGYVKLFDNNSIEWDAEMPRLSNEDYNDLLKENGLLDSIAGMITKQEDYSKYQKTKFVFKLLEQADDYSLYLQLRHLDKEFKLWESFQRQTVEPFIKLDLQQIQSYSFILADSLVDLIGEEAFNTIEASLKRVQSLYRAANSNQRAYNEMLSQRNNLSQHLREHAEKLSLSQCPLCGQNYETYQQLLESIENTLEIQLSSFDAINDNVIQGFNQFKQLVSKTIEFITIWFGEQGVNNETVASYRALKVEELSKNVRWLEEKGWVFDLPKENVEQTKIEFRDQIHPKAEAYDEQLDYDTLKVWFDGYVRYIPKEVRTIDSVQQKRAYLLHLWNQGKSEQMSKLTEELLATQQLLSNYSGLETQLLSVRDIIVSERDEYLKKVITDVEILFYIYSGRIMQDSFYGRGLFLKNIQGKYIYFVSKYNSDMDALYKMSSGQLVALMMALLLSLNKLYSESHFLAIDDPVQTIDDINVWGFVETLRHEFRDYQYLFSTHELSYGSFLRYKLSNMNIKASYVDMMDLRQTAIV